MARAIAIALSLVLALHARPARADNVGDLVTSLGDDSDKVRLSAAAALTRLKTHDLRAIMAMAKAVINDSDKNVRGACAFGLGEAIDDSVKPAIKKLVIANLKKALADDDSDFVRKQAEKALDALGAGTGGAAAPGPGPNPGPTSAAGGVYVNIGPMSSKTGGADDKKLQGQMVSVATAAMTAAAPSYATTWPGGAPPSKAALAAKQVAGFYVDGTLNELKVKEEGSTATISCKISMLLASFPDKSVFGFLNGGASVQASTSPKDEALARGDCVQAVVDNLIRTKIIPTIKTKVP